jgi:transcriptional regulator with XRE-family HTH domain
MNAAPSALTGDSNSHLAADVGAALRDARQRRGQSQRDVATVARTSAATVSRVERGDPQVALTTVDRIATSLGVHFTFRFSRRIIGP